MAYKVLGVGIGFMFLAGCIPLTKPDAEQPPQVAVEHECPVVEPVVCPELPTPVEVVPEPVIEPKPEKAVSCPKVAPVKSNVQALGQIEYVDILPVGFRQKARIDTGAEITSLDAYDIVDFERDGKPWVKFTVSDRANNGEAVVLKEPVKRTVLVKQHGTEDARRQVVVLTLAIGDLKDEVEVTLADRENFEYPILIGRNFLQGRAMVDVSRKFLALEK